MKLDVWLRQPHTPVERLRLVERLSQALNAVHDRGEVLASLQPSRVEVGSDLRCDLSAAATGSPEPGYAAPERLEGGRPSTGADVYAAGAIAWEALAGRPCGELPAALAGVAPSLPRELASAVMGCLERSPQWRPKDLTYLAQLAAAHQKAARRGRAEPSPDLPPPASLPRTPLRRRSRSHLPLLGAAAFVAGLAALSYWWIERSSPPAARPVAAGRSPTLPAAIPGPTTAAAPGPATAAIPEPLPAPVALASPAAADPATGAEPSRPTPDPADAADAGPDAPAVEAAVEPEVEPAARAPEPPPPSPGRGPEPPAVADASTGTPPAAVEPPATPAGPATLAALSPLSVRRPGKVLLDLRGSGLRPDQRARVLPLRHAPRGITVVRQKWVDAALVTVLLDLDETVAAGAYAIALEDAAGGRTTSLSFTVTK
jgi:hypothetical protein